MDHFKLHSEYQPTGDQPQAIIAVTAKKYVDILKKSGYRNF